MPKFYEITFRAAGDPKRYHRLRRENLNRTLCGKDVRGAGLKGIGLAEPCPYCVAMLQVDTIAERGRADTDRLSPTIVEV